MMPAMRPLRGSNRLGVRERFAARTVRAIGRLFGGSVPREMPFEPGNGSESDRQQQEIDVMKWERPAATDMRFGFEITMYIANR